MAFEKRFARFFSSQVLPCKVSSGIHSSRKKCQELACQFWFYLVYGSIIFYNLWKDTGESCQKDSWLTLILSSTSYTLLQPSSNWEIETADRKLSFWWHIWNSWVSPIIWMVSKVIQIRKSSECAWAICFVSGRVLANLMPVSVANTNFIGRLHDSSLLSTLNWKNWHWEPPTISWNYVISHFSYFHRDFRISHSHLSELPNFL